MRGGILERGVKFNHPEAIVYISDWIFEGARNGESVTELRTGASASLSRDDVIGGVPGMIDMVQVEPTFPDGMKLGDLESFVGSEKVLYSDDFRDVLDALLNSDV